MSTKKLSRTNHIIFIIHQLFYNSGDQTVRIRLTENARNREGVLKKYYLNEAVEWEITTYKYRSSYYRSRTRNYYSDSNTYDESSQKIKIRTSQMLQCLSSLKITEASEAIYVYTCHQWHTSGYVIIGTLALVALLLYLIVPISLAVLYIKNQQGKSRTCFVYSSKGSDSQSLTYQINGTQQSKKQIIVKVCYL